jgi:Xaa-Pro aminopeptidase
MSPSKISTPLNQNRLASLRAKMLTEQIDGLLITQPENRVYFSGFTGSAGWLMISADQALLATDFRYFEQVGRQCPDYDLIKIPQRFTEVLPGMLTQTGIQRLAFEADAATFSDASEWAATAPDCEWVPVKGWGIKQRSIKDPQELATLRSAVKLADEALAASLDHVRLGMRERDLAWIIESYMRTHGAQGVAFSTIVACGPNGSLPHAVPSDTPLVTGEPIVIDMGARIDGYCSDITRTVCFGEPNDPEKFWSVYNTVLQAQQAAAAALRPGATGEEIDMVARSVITDAGYGDYFGHSLGHGVGLAVHELPRLSRTNPDPLPAGSLVTNEPGIYLPGWGGVRIEDILLITDDGAEVLTGMHKDPILPLG